MSLEDEHKRLLVVYVKACEEAHKLALERVEETQEKLNEAKKLYEEIGKIHGKL